MNNKGSITEIGCETLAGGCFWADFWSSFEPLANFTAHDGFRNIALVIAAIVTLFIALRRANIADEDKRTSIKRAETSEAGLNIDRFQKGIEMLSSDQQTIRKAGILILSELAQKDMQNYFDPIQTILCSFARENSESAETLDIDLNPTVLFSRPPDRKEAGDTEITIKELSKLNKLKTGYPQFKYTEFDLHRINLQFAKLQDCDLEDALLYEANLDMADLSRSNLKFANFDGASLIRANLYSTQLEGTKFEFANLENTRFTYSDISIDQLEEADVFDTELQENLIQQLPKEDY